MPEKIGFGGAANQPYDPRTGKYIEDGKPNSSYNNPEEITSVPFSVQSFAKRFEEFTGKKLNLSTPESVKQREIPQDVLKLFGEGEANPKDYVYDGRSAGYDGGPVINERKRLIDDLSNISKYFKE